MRLLTHLERPTLVTVTSLIGFVLWSWLIGTQARASQLPPGVLYDTYNFTDIPFDDAFFGGNTVTGQTDTATLSGYVRVDGSGNFHNYLFDMSVTGQNGNTVVFDNANSTLAYLDGLSFQTDNGSASLALALTSLSNPGPFDSGQPVTLDLFDPLANSFFCSNPPYTSGCFGNNDNGSFLISADETAVTFTPVPTLASTPLPGTLLLFVSGLGGLGLLGWRRKRKNAAALAA